MYRFLSLTLLSIAFAALSGCQSISSLTGSEPSSTPEPEPKVVNGVVQRSPFPVEEYAHLSRSGSSSISGQVIIKHADGTVEPMTGPEVLAVPVTSYSREAYEALANHQKISPADSRAQKFTVRTLGDDQGQFRFSRLPAGSYYLITQARWIAVVHSERQQQTKVIQREVSVGKGKTVTVKLSAQ